MAADGVIIFDEDSTSTSVEGDSGRTFVVLSESSDLLTFDPAKVSLIDDSAPTSDFVIFDAEVTQTETAISPPDFMLVDEPKGPASVVLDEDLNTDLLVITSGGAPGPPGPVGIQGPQGEPGLAGPGAYFQEFGFATPLTTWTVVHNLGTFGLSVETVDTNGDPIEGYVRYVDSNTIEVDWYYPTAGAVRLFR